MRCTCLLLGVKQTWLFAAHMSAFDPKRTSDGEGYGQTVTPFLRSCSGHKLLGRSVGQHEHLKKSAVIKRSILINGRKTSVSLENEFWRGLHDVARSTNAPLAKLVDQIDRDRDNVNLSSAIRVFVFNQLKK